MKTKFSEILKVKKQKLSEIEQKLANLRHEKEIITTQLAETLSKINAFTLPKSGDYTQMQMALGQKEYLFREKEQKENMLKYYDQEIEAANLLYKEANIEYEKIKHLHDMEEQSMMEEAMRKEAKRMDEVANQLFLRTQGKEES